MNNIKIAIKRFFKNKNTVTIIAVLLSLVILYWAYTWRIKKATEPISVPYSLSELEPRTFITADMVSTRKVPGSMVTANVITNSSMIIGKYVSNDAVIPQGSLFYSNTLKTWEEMPRSVYADIPEGHTIVSLPVTLESTYGNSIFPGNYIDLYFVTRDRKSSKLILGKLIESIKVLAVMDGDGNNVFEKSIEVEPPASLIFSVPEKIHLLLRKALYLNGSIIPVPRNAEYSTNPKETKISSSYLENLINSQTINVSEEDLNEITTENGGEE